MYCPKASKHEFSLSVPYKLPFLLNVPTYGLPFHNHYDVRLKMALAVR